MASAYDTNNSSDRQFVRTAMKVALLEPAHEANLARRWREHDDEAALHELTTAYMRLVIAMAAKFRHYGLPMADLVSEGNVGLMQAAARFEPEREVRFSTYASWWIRSSIQDYVLRNWSIVRTGTTSAQKSLFFNLRRLRARISDTGDGIMSVENREWVAEHLGVPVRDVETMASRLSGSDRSLNAPLSADGDGEWQDLIADEA
ncbi:MAG: sigma-70 family RNA polymerase sigma factor, partial [Hyphomonas sp.]|uniref:sigma-70 family RNA polymerase sigma factor n=1 Tax=Hyphomonas sp. TaxID=87 RepID=UPI0034A033DF